MSVVKQIEHYPYSATEKALAEKIDILEKRIKDLENTFLAKPSFCEPAFNKGSC